jgi:glycine betaine/choline ABC-type transport system substrate-binding protein
MSVLDPQAISDIAKHLTEQAFKNGFITREDAFRWIESNYGFEYTSPDKGLAPEVADAFKNLRGSRVKWNGWTQRWEEK